MSPTSYLTAPPRIKERKVTTCYRAGQPFFRVLFGGPMPPNTLTGAFPIGEFNGPSSGGERDVAQSGSAPQWGCGGRRFESGRPDSYTISDQALCPLGSPALQRKVPGTQGFLVLGTGGRKNLGLRRRALSWAVFWANEAHRPTNRPPENVHFRRSRDHPLAPGPGHVMDLEADRVGWGCSPAALHQGHPRQGDSDPAKGPWISRTRRTGRRTDRF